MGRPPLRTSPQVFSPSQIPFSGPKNEAVRRLLTGVSAQIWQERRCDERTHVVERSPYLPTSAVQLAEVRHLQLHTLVGDNIEKYWRGVRMSVCQLRRSELFWNLDLGQLTHCC